MCAICGCGGTDEHVHADGTRHSHPTAHGSAPRPELHLELEADILSRNDALAARNGAWLARRGAVALNLMGSPGSGKTTLLERAIRQLGPRVLQVIEGDQATANDAERILAAGARVVQVNTGTGCHLDADMVGRALEELDPAAGALIAVENVGNLVCPALFRLGEAARVVVLSVAEGDDKPIKYPHMFRAADLVLVNKIDLLPYVDFSVDRATANLRAVNASAEVMQVSARTGLGLEAWYRWLSVRRPAVAAIA